MILSVVTEQHTEGSSKKKTFKVLCQFRVLVEWKKRGGILNLCFLLCLTKSTHLDTGPASSCGKSLKNTTRFYYCSGDFDPREEVNARAARVKGKEVLPHEGSSPSVVERSAESGIIQMLRTRR